MFNLRRIVVVTLLVVSVQAVIENEITDEPEQTVRLSSHDKNYGEKGVHSELHFVGFQGQPFSVHTKSGSIYSLISMPSLYLNARLLDMSTGEHCAAETVNQSIPERQVGECVAYPGIYMTQIGLVSGDDRIIVDGAARGSPLSVQVNGSPFTWSKVTIKAANGTLEFDADMFTLTYINDDMRITIRNVDRFVTVSVDILNKEWLQQGRRANIPRNQGSRYANNIAGSQLPTKAHGLLGQTLNYIIYPGGSVIQGESSDYIVSAILSHQFAYSLYGDARTVAAVQYPQ